MYKTMKEALESISVNDYQYALVYMMSEVYLGDTSNMPTNYDEILEVRLFDGTKEAHIYEDEDGYEVTTIDDSFACAFTKEKMIQLATEKEKCLKVKVYYVYDEDGQAQVACTRCCGLGGN